jgi:hypothetical protein
MSMVGFYFFSSLLNEAGWPRKQGLFRRLVIDTTIADSSIDQMITWAASLGAGRPHLALKIIAEMFRDRDWDGVNAPMIQGVINGSRESWDKKRHATPQEIVEPIRLARIFGAVVSPKKLGSSTMLRALEQYVLESVVWGLANPDRFTKWYDDRWQRYSTRLDFYQKSGLAVDELPLLDEFYKGSEKILRNYERDVSPLAEIPAKLLSDVIALGININESK